MYFAPITLENVQNIILNYIIVSVIYLILGWAIPEGIAIQTHENNEFRLFI